MSAHIYLSHLSRRGRGDADQAVIAHVRAGGHHRHVADEGLLADDHRRDVRIVQVSADEGTE